MVDLVALKDLMQPVLPLIGVLVGASMTGIGQMYKARQERKRIVAMALNDLMEVRHRIVSLNLVFKHFQEQSDLPTESIPHLRNLMDHLLPLDEKLDSRFDEAVTLLAGIDPVLAYELRSKNQLPRFINKIRLIAANAGEDLAGFEQLERGLIEVVTPVLDEAVLHMAGYHSRHTRNEVKKILENSRDIASELVPLLSGLGKLEKSGKGATSP